MPIHDQSYRRYKGGRAPQGRAWTVIATAGIRHMLAKKKFLALLVLAWLPFVVRAVQMYLAANFAQLSRHRAVGRDVPPVPRVSRTPSSSSSRSSPAPGSSRTTCAPTRCRSTWRSR